MIRIRISETGSREKGSKEFGYIVTHPLGDTEGRDYTNRARLRGEEYVLEDSKFIAILVDQQTADQFLYERAREVARKTLEEFEPYISDETEMFRKLQPKSKKPRKKK